MYQRLLSPILLSKSKRGSHAQLASGKASGIFSTLVAIYPGCSLAIVSSPFRLIEVIQTSTHLHFLKTGRRFLRPPKAVPCFLSRRDFKNVFHQSIYTAYSNLDLLWHTFSWGFGHEIRTRHLTFVTFVREARKTFSRSTRKIGFKRLPLSPGLSRDNFYTCPPLPLIFCLLHPRFWDTRDQTGPGSLLARPGR